MEEPSGRFFRPVAQWAPIFSACCLVDSLAYSRCAISPGGRSMKFRILRPRWILVLAVVVCGLTSTAFALRIAMPNLTSAQKATRAEVIVTGKVVEIEKERDS